MADGSIVIDTRVDSGKLPADLQKVTAQVEKQTIKVEELKRQYDDWAKVVEAQKSNFGTVSDVANNGLRRASANLREAEARLAQLNERVDELQNNTDNAQTAMDKFTKRIIGLAKRVFVFSLITKALRSVRSYLDAALKSNNEYSASLAQLKGAALTAAQPLLNMLIPALTTLLRVLTAVVGTISKVTSALFGKTVNQSAEAAKALNDEANAIKGVGGAAKKASRSLASFDELNILASDSGTGAAGGVSGLEVAPDFTWMDNMSDNLKKIADAVLLIAAGFALWKIASGLRGALGMLATTLGSILVTVGGLILLWQGLKDAWENGIDWKNAALMVGGLATAALGLYKIFGNVGVGIMLVVGGLALLVTGFKDAMENGWNLQNTLVAIAGIVATGLGIAFLTGSIIPALVAGISGVLLAITNLTGNGQQLLENLKQAFGGLKDFIVGVFTGDTEKALEGLKNFAKGIFNSILTVFGSLVNLIIRGLNWLIGKINSIRFTVPDWVPGVGGRSLSPRIPSVKEWAIPKLAQGAVIPPNKSFMAVLGDQKSGTNIEAPLDTIKQALSEVMGEYGGGNVNVDVYLDGERVTDRVVKRINNRSRASGKTVLV